MIALSLIITSAIVLAAWAAFTQKDYKGFSTTTQKKIANGEIPWADIKTMEQSIKKDAEDKKQFTTHKVSL